jgi:hypothetical protein
MTKQLTHCGESNAIVDPCRSRRMPEIMDTQVLEASRFPSGLPSVLDRGQMLLRIARVRE